VRSDPVSIGSRDLKIMQGALQAPIEWESPIPRTLNELSALPLGPALFTKSKLSPRHAANPLDAPGPDCRSLWLTGLVQDFACRVGPSNRGKRMDERGRGSFIRWPASERPRSRQAGRPPTEVGTDRAGLAGNRGLFSLVLAGMLPWQTIEAAPAAAPGSSTGVSPTAPSPPRYAGGEGLS